jgi:pimeloyl-ACP methyl ester carboxylesterase
MFTPAHRGGAGPPLVLLHGFMESWRSWELVLPALERRHDVLALTLAGHAGGPPIEGDVGASAVLGAIERAMDDAGMRTAHVAGNSLGGYAALKLAERGRARTVVALAPAGGWAEGDGSYKDVLAFQAGLLEQVKAAAPYAEALLATPEGRRRATESLTVEYEHIPVELLAHQMRAIAACTAGPAMIESGLRDGWPLDPELVTCPVRIVWGTEDRLLEWPRAAARYRAWLPHADWIELDGVGHAPQLDVPLEAAQLILGFTSSA